MSKFKNTNFISYSFLLFFSISINQYYGFKGTFPLDTFLYFDGGFRVLNGYFPFKDYWTVVGPAVDIFQSFFFKIFGISWFSYVFHASIFNFLLASSTFYTLNKLNLNINYCLIYSTLVSVIAYPISGTPFADHHSLIFSLIALFCFILHLKSNSNFYLFLIPIFLILGFLSKQTPAGYIILIISTMMFLYIIFNFDIKKIFFLSFGFSLILVILFFFLYINEINFDSFYKQYILFPLTIGDIRYSEFLFPLEFSRIVTRFKYIHIALLPLIFLVVKNLFENPKYFKDINFFILISLILVSWSAILHQLLTKNQKFIYFLIPILAAFSHIYYDQYQKKIFNYFLIFLSVGCTIYYTINYVDNRRFMEMKDVDFKKSLNSGNINKKLKNLKWINPDFAGEDEPAQEIALINETIKILSSDKRNKMLITHYQFMASILPSYVYSPSKTYTMDGISYPLKGNKYHNDYKKLFIDQIKNKKIAVIYLMKPIEESSITFVLDKSCIKLKKINNILESYEINECKQLNN